MTGDRDKFVWRPSDVEVRAPRTCEACRQRPADSEIAGLCGECATSIDRDYEWVRDIADLEHGP